MSESFRHHRASREIVFVPIVIGSPEPFPHRPPPKYPSSRPAPWRPQRAIPSNSKGAATVRLLDAISRNEAAARQMLTPRPHAAPVTR